MKVLKPVIPLLITLLLYAISAGGIFAQIPPGVCPPERPISVCAPNDPADDLGGETDCSNLGVCSGGTTGWYCCTHPSTCASGTGISTGLGCIEFDNLNSTATRFLSIGIGIAGGVSFLMIVYAGFLLITSTGNPERIKQGQDLMTAAFAGLVMIIFSVVILHFIGVSILGLRLG